MKKGLKKITMTLAVVLTVTTMMSFAKVPVLAAGTETAQKVDLKTGRTYTEYDVTGDKRPDKIRIMETGDNGGGMHTGLTVKVNGKTAYKIKNYKYGYYSAEANLLTLANGKVFLYLYVSGDNGDGPVCAILQYQKKTGKYKKVVDFIKLMDNYGFHNNGSIESVSGNSITCQVFSVCNSLGVSEYSFTYTWNGGKLKCEGNKGKLLAAYDGFGEIKKFKANKTIPVYTKAGGDKVGFKLKKGNKVTVDKVRIKNSNMWIHVKKGEKSGWIKALKESPLQQSKQQFSNIMYAG